VRATARTVKMFPDTLTALAQSTTADVELSILMGELFKSLTSFVGQENRLTNIDDTTSADKVSLVQKAIDVFGCMKDANSGTELNGGDYFTENLDECDPLDDDALHLAFTFEELTYCLREVETVIEDETYTNQDKGMRFYSEFFNTCIVDNEDMKQALDISFDAGLEIVDFGKKFFDCMTCHFTDLYVTDWTEQVAKCFTEVAPHAASVTFPAMLPLFSDIFLLKQCGRDMIDGFTSTDIQIDAIN
jgi:hypothetical protein